MSPLRRPIRPLKNGLVQSLEALSLALAHGRRPSARARHRPIPPNCVFGREADSEGRIFDGPTHGSPKRILDTREVVERLRLGGVRRAAAQVWVQGNQLDGRTVHPARAGVVDVRRPASVRSRIPSSSSGAVVRSLNCFVA